MSSKHTDRRDCAVTHTEHLQLMLMSHEQMRGRVYLIVSVIHCDIDEPQMPCSKYMQVPLEQPWRLMPHHLSNCLQQMQNSAVRDARPQFGQSQAHYLDDCCLECKIACCPRDHSFASKSKLTSACAQGSYISGCTKSDAVTSGSLL
jgi:hypothetical protein